jgi:hypothetical protein
MLFKPGISIRILGGSEHQSRHMFRHLRALLDPERAPAIAPHAQPKITSSRITFVNGSEVEILAQSETSVRGSRVQKLRCDEVDLFRPDVWEACQLTTISRRCGEREVRGVVECLSTMHNPHGLMHRVVNEARQGRRSLFRWGVLDVLAACDHRHVCRLEHGPPCPLLDDCGGRAKSLDDAGHLSIADAITLKGRVGLATWQAEMLCHRPRRTNCVYPEFDRQLHVVDRMSMPPHVRDAIHGVKSSVHAETTKIVAGMDFGFVNPTAIVWGCLDSEGVLTIFAEYEEKERTLDEQVKVLLHRAPRPEWIGADPAGHAPSHHTGKSSIRVLHDAGLQVRTRRSDLASGINAVRALLRPAIASDPVRLRIDASCTRLIECLECYCYPALDGPPIKAGHDHLADALRYMVTAMATSAAVKTERYWAA